MNTEASLLNLVAVNPAEVTFEEVMAVIDEHYDFIPTAFRNGTLSNSETQNLGSCKLFAFAQLHSLDQSQTLALFAQHYQSVLAAPEGDAHQNIRQFMANGWDGIEFEGFPLSKKR